MLRRVFFSISLPVLQGTDRTEGVGDCQRRLSEKGAVPSWEMPANSLSSAGPTDVILLGRCQFRPTGQRTSTLHRRWVPEIDLLLIGVIGFRSIPSGLTLVV